MKNLLCIILVLISNEKIIAQPDSLQRHRFSEIGMNLSSLFTSIINGSGSTSINPYILTYKYVGNRNVIRSGFGFSTYRTTSNSDTLQDFTIKNSSFDFRVGYERQFAVLSKWRAGLGIDLLYNHSESSLRSLTFLDIVHQGSKSFTIGGGPVVTVQFDMNRRISFGTECTLYLHYKEETTYETFDVFPEFNSSQTTIFNSIQLSPPANLYLVVRL